jgi:hypothetical protein
VRIPTLAVAAVLLSAGSAAVAAPCYVVFDRNDAVIYRDYKPPFDLSDTKSQEREMMRRQGQHLLVAEFIEECNPVGFISPTTGATTASVEEIVNDVRPAIASSVAKSGATQTASRPGAAPAPQTGTAGSRKK